MPALAPIERVSVRTHLADLRGYSKAALVLCDDGKKYVIKRAGLSRPLAAEQIVGRLGARIGAPCMKVALADVPAALISVDPKLNRFAGGPAHATAHVDGVHEIRAVQYADLPPNRERFAALLVLYSVARAHDHQFMYAISPPQLVYSHDHGHFFPGGPGWNAATVAAEAVANWDPRLNGHGLTATEMKPAIDELRGVTDSELTGIVAGVPPEWGVSASDLDALSKCLIARKQGLLALYDAL